MGTLDGDPCCRCTKPGGETMIGGRQVLTGKIVNKTSGNQNAMNKCNSWIFQNAIEEVQRVVKGETGWQTAK